MKNEGTERSTISLKKTLDKAAKSYASENRLKFSTLVEDALERLLTSEGVMLNNKNDYLKRIAEAFESSGLTLEEFEEGVVKMLERKVCNG